jgi:ATP-dependent Clp protease ATP-binding subunit ClpA
MFERFTRRARRVLVLAQEETRKMRHRRLGTEHLLLGLIVEGEGVAARALSAAGITYDQVRAEVERIIGPNDSEALAAIGIDLDAITAAVDESFGEGALERSLVGVGIGGAPPFAPRTKKALELSLREAMALGHNYIGTEHLLLAILRMREGVAYDILETLSDGTDLRARVLETIEAA